jgi:hypothetical protein
VVNSLRKVRRDRNVGRGKVEVVGHAWASRRSRPRAAAADEAKLVG